MENSQDVIKRFSEGAHQPPVAPKDNEGLQRHAGGLLHTMNGEPRLDGRGQIKAEKTGFEPADRYQSGCNQAFIRRPHLTALPLLRRFLGYHIGDVGFSRFL